MNTPDPKWQRLVVAARGVGDDREAAAPHGFATRVAAQAFGADRSAGSLLERFAWRALGVACLLTLVSTAASYSLFSTSSVEEDSLTDDSAVAALLEMSS